MIRNYIHLLRPQEYVKNLFLFIPLFFGLLIDDMHIVSKATVAFLSFCLVASAIYIINDLYDIEEDRIHLHKKNRPLASGKVGRGKAIALSAVLLVAGLLLSHLSGILLYAGSYILINVLYTVALKHISILDVNLIAVGFVIRVFAGGAIGGLQPTPWIVSITYLLALFLAFAKRRDDVHIYLTTSRKTRKVIDGYNMEFLNAGIVISATMVIVFYVIYTVSPSIRTRFKTDILYLSTIFVVMGILRYLQITFLEQKSGSPTDIFFKDRFIQGAIVGWVAVMYFLIY